MKPTRIEKVINNMLAMGLEQIIVSDPDSIYYLCGIGYDAGERLLALYLNSHGDVVLFNNRMFPQAEQAGLRILAYEDVDDYMGLVAAAVRPGPLGVDKFWRAKFLLPLLEKRPDLRACLGSPAVDQARMLKDGEEIRLMRQASLLNDRSMAEAVQHLGAGFSERELGAFISRCQVKLGADKEIEQLICYGANGSEPHHASGNALLQPGEGAVIDIYAPVNRYCCDMTRTVFWKSVSPEQRRVYEIVRQANEAGRAAVRPGIPISEIDRITRKVIEDAGYGPYFIHRTGHGIGLTLHEPPDCSSVSQEILQPGMVFSVEPGIYLPGQFGVRVEDLVAVTEDGAETLNHFDRELLIVP